MEDCPWQGRPVERVDLNVLAWAGAARGERSQRIEVNALHLLVPGQRCPAKGDWPCFVS